MRSRQQFYQQGSAKLPATHPAMHQKRRTVWVIVGVILGRSVQLSSIAHHIPGEAEAAGRRARVRRWLAHQQLGSRDVYTPLIEDVLQAWRNREVTRMLDGCFIRHRTLQMLRVSLSHCYRAVPLAWKVRTSKGLVSLSACDTMRAHVAPLLTHTRRVTLLAERGFRDRAWAQKWSELGWNYLIGIANTTLITFPGGVHRTVEQLELKKGERRLLPNVRLTHAADWPCHLALTGTRATASCPAELCAVMTDVPASGWALRHYRKRMHIEERFRDETSGSFDLHASHLVDAQRLDPLVLAVAVAVLWMYALGERVLRDEQRGTLDPAYKRQLSTFQ